MLRRLRGLVLSLACVGVLSGFSQGQDGAPPPPDSEIVAVERWEQPREAPMQSSGPATRETYQQILPQSYFSPTLKGHFLAQWMYVTINGRRIEFWGARIVRLEPGSALRQLGLHPGDVITRLDGIAIWRDMYKEPGRAWQLVEMENHFGRTEVRFIHRGQNRVQIGDIMLDGTYPDGINDIDPIRP